MDLALVCLIVLVAVLVVSCVSSLNVGLAALAAAWVIGVYVAPAYGQTIGLKGVTAGFPVDLFLTLAGTTLLFAAAQTNGTLALVVDRSVRLCGDNARLLPPLYFLLALVLSAVGPGNIASPALLAPSALALAARLRIPPLVMIMAVAHGAIAGGAVPVTPIGVIVTGEYVKLGIQDRLTSTFLLNAAVNLLLACLGGLIFGGRWWLRPTASKEVVAETPAETTAPFLRQHLVTLLTIVALLVTALVAPLEIGLAAFAAAAVLFLSRSADERTSVAAMPWNVILLVVGVSTFVKLCESTGAVGLLSQSMKHIADERTVVGWSAFFTGLISIFSSTSGVVLPTFLPMAGSFVGYVGGDPATATTSVAAAIVIGSSAVDVSPLSTIGALCIAAAAKTTDTRPLFNRMLLWGFAMAPLSAVICQLLLR